MLAIAVTHINGTIGSLKLKAIFFKSRIINGIIPE